MSQSESFSSLNPSDGSVVWTGPVASGEAVNNAVQTARRTLTDWSARPIEERAGLLREFSERLKEQREALAKLIAREIGKPLWESRTEVDAMVAKVDISIKAHEARTSTFSSGPATTRFRPHGVLAVIGPYNFPGHLPNGHICPALLAGNTVVFKPSELAPATAELTVELWQKAGLPDGALQLVQGGAGPSIALAGHPDIDGILFTGSAATGKKLATAMAATPGRILALEMGGNNPLIVDPGNIGDLDAAAEITLRSAFLSAGQRCTCARRLVLIESPEAGTFLERLLERTRSITVDDPFNQPQPFMGPLASIEFPQAILREQARRLVTGAQALLGSKHLQKGTGFVSPAVLDVTAIEQLPDEEIFGPVLQLIRVSDLEAAIKVANDTRYGLAAGMLTDREADYAYAGPRLRAGIINWNTQLTGASSAAPFGGIKDSGNLRPSAYFAADYCAYPVASMEAPACKEQPRLPGR